MSLSIGGKSSKGSTTQNSTGTINQTQTSDLPDWLKAPNQSLTGSLTNLFSTDPSSLTPGPSANQTMASNNAAGLNGSKWNVDAATDVTRGLLGKNAPTVQAGSLLDGLDKYQNPYMDDVVNSTMADFDQNAGAQRAQDDLALAGQGAFGGSGAALTKSMTADNLARARATTYSGLRSDAFNTAAGLSNQDAQRRQAASEANANLELQNRDQRSQLAQQLASMGWNQDANTRQNIATQSGVGGVDRQITQEQAQAPFSMQAMLEQLYQGLDPSLFASHNTTGTQTSNSTGTSKGSGFEWGASASWPKSGGGGGN